MEFNLTYNRQENILSSPIPLIGTFTTDLLGEVTLLTNPLENLNVVLGFLQERRANYTADSYLYQSIPSYDYEPMSAYAQGDYRIGESVKLIAGAQWNESSLGGSDWVSRGGIILTPVQHWGLKLLRGEAFRAPVTLESDLWDPPNNLIGNKNLKPETITTYDVQLFYNDNKTYAAITYFDSTIKDLIIYDTAPTPWTYKNGGRQSFNGVELEVKRFLNPHWHVLGSFMHQDNKEDIGLNPSIVPDNMAKLGTGYTWEGGSVGVFYSYFGTPPNITSPLVVNPKPEDIHLVSINMRLDVSRMMGLSQKRSILTLKVENLFDEEIYAPTFAYTGSPNSFPFGPGITCYGGWRINF